jgi:hypothetical protein
MTSLNMYEYAVRMNVSEQADDDDDDDYDDD